MKPRTQVEGTLQYPKHWIKPEDYLHFVELDGFIDDWKALDLSVENDLWALQIMIMADPTGNPVVKGTGGLRKIRFATSSSGGGKSGGTRVCYVYLPEYFMVLLVCAYAKSQQVDLDESTKKGFEI